MGVSLGWLAVSLALSGASELPEKAAPEITYQFQSVEVRGLGWRENAAGLKPVAQHGGVSVWTAPADFAKKLVDQENAVVADVGSTAGKSLTPAHLTTRKDRSFVTHVSWKGNDRSPEAVSEKFHSGLTATVIGRKLDQGVLVQLVVEDTDIRTVHSIGDGRCSGEAKACVETGKTTTVTISASMKDEAPADSRTAAPTSAEACPPGADAKAAGWQPSKDAPGDPNKAQPPCCPDGHAVASKADDQAARASHASTGPKIQIPEIGRASAAGEWLIPEDGVLVVGFGPHTVADAEGKAVVREHLAVIRTEVDEIESSDVPAPRLPKIHVESPPAAPRAAMGLPELPSRSLPQPMNADGTPATLPTLPDEADQGPADESAPPTASPQSKRKAEPRPAEADRPAEDAKLKKAEDVKPQKVSFSLPPLRPFGLKAGPAFGLPIQGAQFLVPLRAMALKLPFSQKLEFEIVGRVVNDPDAVDETRITASK